MWLSTLPSLPLQVNVMVVLKALRKFKKLLKQRRERKAKLIRSMSGKGGTTLLNTSGSQWCAHHW